MQPQTSVSCETSCTEAFSHAGTTKAWYQNAGSAYQQTELHPSVQPHLPPTMLNPWSHAGTTTAGSAYQQWEVQPRAQHPPAQLAPTARFEGASESASQFQQKPIAARAPAAPAQLPEHLPFEGGC